MTSDSLEDWNNISGIKKEEFQNDKDEELELCLNCLQNSKNVDKFKTGGNNNSNILNDINVNYNNNLLPIDKNSSALIHHFIKNGPNINVNVNKELYEKIDLNNDFLELNEERTKETNASDKDPAKKVNNNDKLSKLKNDSIRNINNVFIVKDNHIYDYKNMNEIMDKIKIDLNINMENQNNQQFLGQKRKKTSDFNTNNYSKEKLFDEIYSLYNRLNGNGFQIFEQKNGILDNIYTLIESKKPICIVYFRQKILEKIFLIQEVKFLYSEKEILEVLNIIKSNVEI